MDLKDVFALLERFESSSASLLEVELGEGRVRLEKGGRPAAALPAPVVTEQAPAAPAPQAEPSKAAEGLVLKAPLVGTFYGAPAPGEAPFVKPGDRVGKGQTVCVLEAMKMMSEVPAPMDCVIEEVLASDGDLVGFDAPLFRVREV